MSDDLTIIQFLVFQLENAMKKTLIHLAVLQTAALAASAHAKDRVISLRPGEAPQKSTETIVTREMLADKRPIHIGVGGGCSDIDHGGGSGGIRLNDGQRTAHAQLTIPTSRGPEGITKLHPAQFGQHARAAQPVGLA